jgi:hypothetical protein
MPSFPPNVAPRSVPGGARGRSAPGAVVGGRGARGHHDGAAAAVSRWRPRGRGQAAADGGGAGQGERTAAMRCGPCSETFECWCSAVADCLGPCRCLGTIQRPSACVAAIRHCFSLYFCILSPLPLLMGPGACRVAPTSTATPCRAAAAAGVAYEPTVPATLYYYVKWSLSQLWVGRLASERVRSRNRPGCPTQGAVFYVFPPTTDHTAISVPLKFFPPTSEPPKCSCLAGEVAVPANAVQRGLACPMTPHWRGSDTLPSPILTVPPPSGPRAPAPAPRLL